MDAFVTKLNHTGSLIWATYIGGTGNDEARAMTVDANGNCFLTGFTQSADFSGAINSEPGSSGGTDVFVAKVTGSGSLAWAMYMGGTDQEYGNGIAVNGSGNLLVAGYTQSSDFVGAVNAPHASGSVFQDGFVAKVSPAGSLRWMEYLGSSWGEATALALDKAGNALVTGNTETPIPGANNSFLGQSGMDFNVFVAKVAGDGTVAWATHVGGNGQDLGGSIVVDGDGNALLSGTTMSTNFAGANNTFSA